MVLLLPPRIGKVHEHGAGARSREAREYGFGVFRQYPRTRAETPLAQTIIDDGRPFAPDFEAEHAHLGIGRESLEQEAAPARPDFDFDRLTPRAHQQPRIDDFAFGQARRVRVRIRFHDAVDAKTARVLAQADSPRWLRIAESPWTFLALAAALGAVAVKQVLAAAGAPAMPLDDSYIHLQFARSFAEGHPFVYSPGAAPVAGATSLLWPLLLAIPQLIGARGLDVVPWAWAFGFAALGLQAYEATRAAQKLVSRELSWVAGVLVLAFSANTWFAGSGMEVVPLGYLLLRCARRAAEWHEGERERLWELLLLAFLTAILRPEGALGCVLIASVLLTNEHGWRKAYGALALAFIAVPPLVYFAFTGHATQTTTLVKWLPFSPYLTFGGVIDVVIYNVKLFLTTLLDGQLWSAAYVPEHSRFVALLALPALIFAGQARRVPARSWLLVVLGLGILIPTTYDSFLWNRLRYLWPFSAPWLIGLVALADQLGELTALARPRLGLVRYVISAGLALALALKLPFALSDLADSARAISSQHVELGEWAKSSLPAQARIGVNDTGAIAYFSDHPVFDIVGLTTVGEARYWSAGAGSRFEHYEHLSRAVLPTHFIVYPQWFGLPQLFGTCLTERTVYATILGGETMVACEADYGSLGTGEGAASTEFWQATPLDSLDVADLESEREHGYVLLPAAQADDVVLSDGIVTDGARRHRQRDSFRLRVAPGARFVARLGADSPSTVRIGLGRRVIGNWLVQSPRFEEHSLELPPDVPNGPLELEVTAAENSFNVAHYWVYPPGALKAP